MRTRSAFTLLEMLGVLAIATLLAVIILPGITERALTAQLKQEDEILAALAKDITASLDSSDFTNINILPSVDANTVSPPTTLVGSVPTATNWTPNPDATFTATSAADWFAKIATVRGSTFTTAAPTKNSQPALATLLFNHYTRARLLIAAPAEADKQRLLLISLMAPVEKLIMPTYDGSATAFNALWNTNWDSRTSTLPSTWSSALTAAQIATWNTGSKSGSNLYRLRVVRITVPKYTIAISNNHATDHAWIYYNADNNYVYAAAASGSTVSLPIFAGRLVRVLKGTSLGTATESSRIHLRDNTDVLIQ